ncbi:hypothetical protein EBT16_04145 [bacterium]|nr:hypothetical protein [bacterium]
MIKLKQVQDDITIRLNGMLDRGAAMQSFLNRNVVRMYQNAQRKRFDTANASEGPQWKALSPGYAKRKKRLYVSYIGHGDKILIATGRLYKAIVDIDKAAGGYKLTTPTRLTITTSVEYVKWIEGPDAPVESRRSSTRLSKIS